jgi:hypothetical protein
MSENKKETKYYASLPLPWTDLTTYIDTKDLFEENRFVKCHHISLHVLLPHMWIPEDTAKVFPAKPLEIKLTGLGCFENKDKDVLYAKVQMTDELLKLHKTFVDHYNIKWQHPEYTPHATIAFLKPGTAKKYVESIKWEGCTFQAKSIEWREHGGENRRRATIALTSSSDLFVEGASFMTMTFGDGDDVTQQLRKQLVKWT